jgi:peptidoglycan/xylan/chitin deacetylase (PgdA/CDA1 family)
MNPSGHDCRRETVDEDAKMIADLAWSFRGKLSPSGRKRMRRLVDRVLAPLGSINGASNPSHAVALTFDDGPDPTVTPRLLDLLQRRGVHATFFLLTDRAINLPDIVQRIVAEGHEIALHSDRHDRLTNVPARKLRQRIMDARRSLESISGRPVRLFRPPFGAQSLGTYLAARMCGLDVVVWGPYAEDWIEGTPEASASRALATVKGGDILLLHDGLEMPAGETPPRFDRVRSVELILDGMVARGLQPTSVSQLLAADGTRRTAWFRP